MLLPTIKNVLSLYYIYLSLWLIIFISDRSLVLVDIIKCLVFHFVIFGTYLTSVKAVILIMKQASFLRLSNLSPNSALTLAEVDYHEANVDSTIQQHLATSQEHSIELFVAFIMATDISLFFLASVGVISHQLPHRVHSPARCYSSISVFCENTCID